jgi:hypothetical protein
MNTKPTSGQRAQVMASALFATAMFLMLSAVVFLTPFVVSPYAQQNDVYMGNLFLAPLIFLLGSILLLISLAALGLRTISASALAIVALLVAGSCALSTAGLSFSVYAYLIMAAVVLFLLIGFAIAQAHGWLRLWSRGVLLALLGATALTLLYTFLGGHYTSFGNTSINWPPYLTAPILGATAGLAGAIFAVGWLWTKSTKPLKTSSETV